MILVLLVFISVIVVQNKTSVEETQHAVCKIVTKELQATANVTLTRELKGVCTSSELIKMQCNENAICLF